MNDEVRTEAAASKKPMERLSVWFNGLGRTVQPPTAPAALTQINITNPNNGACKTSAGNEPMRCLRITVNTGGTVRMCDPAVDDATDPRKC